MAISFSCACGQHLQAEKEQAGQRTRCPKCGSDVMIPSIEVAPPTPEPPPRSEPVTLRPPERTSVAAIISLVLGLLSLLFILVTGIPAIIAGIIGLRAIDRSGGRLGGKRMATAGIILGTFGTVCIPCLGMASRRLNQAAAQAVSANNLKQLGIAMHHFNGTGQLPPAVVYDWDGNPLYSWRVLLLPYIEEDALYKEFHLDELWDSPHNKPLLARMPKTYVRPREWPAKEPYATYYQVFDGPGAAFNSDKNKGLKPFSPPGFGAAFGQPDGPALMQGADVSSIPRTFTDGTSTILIAEAADPVPWTKPADLHFDPNGPLPKLGGLFNGNFNVVMADDSVRLISRSVSQTTLRGAITANAGDVLGPDWGR
jgi:hypothetical protein